MSNHGILSSRYDSKCLKQYQLKLCNAGTCLSCQSELAIEQEGNYGI